MSYILDALKRAEQERHIGQLPNAAITPVHEEFDDEPRRWPWILLAIVLTATIAAAFGIWISQSQQAAPSRSGELSAPSVQSSNTITSSPPAMQSYQDSDMPSRVVAVTTSPQIVDEPSRTQQPERNTPLEFSDAEPVEEPPEITAIELFAKAPPQKAPAPKPPAKSTATSAYSPPAAANNQSNDQPEDSDESLPLLIEMDYAFRRSVPAITLQFHRYSDDSERSFVLIDGTRYRQGQTLSAGPTLERIVDNGLVLRWQGERFIYPVGG